MLTADEARGLSAAVSQARAEEKERYLKADVELICDKIRDRADIGNICVRPRNSALKAVALRLEALGYKVTIDPGVPCGRTTIGTEPFLRVEW